MIISQTGNFVFFASTKSASTAIEMALEPFASVAITSPPEVKHMNVRDFEREIVPELDYGAGLDRFIVMREPIEWLFSWYRYRTREDLKGQSRSTANINFNRFVECYLSIPQPDFAKVGKPIRMMKDKKGKIAIQNIYKYAALNSLEAEFSERLGQHIKIPANINASPEIDFDIAPGLFFDLEQYFKDDFEVYESAIG